MRKRPVISGFIMLTLLVMLFALLTGCGKKESEKENKKKDTEEVSEEKEEEEEAKAPEVQLLVEEPENTTLRSDVISEGDFSVDPSVAGNVTFIASDLNVRALPSLASECVGKLELGSWAEIKGVTDDGGFYLIDFSGSDGYIRADLVADLTAAADAFASGEISDLPDAADFEGLDPEKIPDLFWNHVNQ